MLFFQFVGILVTAHHGSSNSKNNRLFYFCYEFKDERYVWKILLSKQMFISHDDGQWLQSRRDIVCPIAAHQHNMRTDRCDENWLASGQHH